MKKMIVLIVLMVMGGMFFGQSHDERLSPAELSAYIQVQEALASDSYMNAQKALVKLSEAAQGKLKVMVKHAAASKDIKLMRMGFKDISNLVIKHKVPKGVKLAFCPMADHNKGGHWLQKGDKIMNPYFGASMLYCGSFKDKK